MKNYNNVSKQEPKNTNTQTTIVDKPVVESNANKQKIAIVTNCIQLNIRKEPTKESDVICVVNRGNKLKIGETVDGWTQVYDKKGLELEGYVMTDFIKEV